ncbi:hypothetical protein LIER_02219 [Lithospermum erythrorhizon]|uniref:Putative plant transposon protein domain-containing protein n=1 Tax=Lithospermum erythrorhizon TaxID=34254 RepID=A0AAV3NNQ0_LITER
MEPSTAVDLEELEKKAEERKRSRKGKMASDVKGSGSVAKKIKGVVISEPRSSKKGDKFVIDDVVELGEEPYIDQKHYGFRDVGATGATLKLSDIIEELTGKELTAWPTKGQLQASHLSLRYAFLHKASIANLVPTSNNKNVSEALGRMLFLMGTEHVLNVGKIIFYQIVDDVKTGAKLKPIGFPSLICSLLITQHPNILRKEDGLGEDAKPLTISDKLMKGKHVIDVEFNATDQPESIPEEEAASMLLRVYGEELLRVEAEIQAKNVLALELKDKIYALKSRVPPDVNASANPVSVAITYANPPDDVETAIAVPVDETSTSQVSCVCALSLLWACFLDK